MKKEQNILTLIIILSVIALVIVIGSILYEEKVKNNKEAVESMIKTTIVESKEGNETIKNDEDENIVMEKEPEEYVGEEEQESQKEETSTQSKEEKAIELAKNEWGEDDSVTFNVEEKKDSKYYVAVKREATVITWYEVDTENWKISEY